jgi:hypothetical protein
MTRWKAIVSVAVLSAAVALQVRAHELDDGSGTGCADGTQKLCKVETTTTCLRWVVTDGSGGINTSTGVSTTTKYTCEKQTTTERTWYYL